MRMLLLLSFFLILSCMREDSPDPPEDPWHGIERSVRYTPDGTDFVILNGERRFNRALYGSNTGFRIEAGDLPEFALYLPGMGGNLKLGIGDGNSNIWLIHAEQITARYRPGSMIYQIKDPLLMKGEIILHLLALNENEGLILKVETKDIPDDLKLYWAYGGVTGKKFHRDGDIGADPESSFYLKPEYCVDNTFDTKEHTFTLFFGKDRHIRGLVPPGGEIRICDARSQDSPQILFESERKDEGLLAGNIQIPDKEEFYFLISVPSPGENSLGLQLPAYENAPVLFDKAEKARMELASRITVRTPDPYINTLGAALSIAADAIWEPPSYLHGSVAWRMRLPGWRGAYSADWLGWHDRAKQHFKGYSKAQYTSPASAPAIADPETNLSRQVEKAGNSLFTRGYISRRPDRINPPHHYDMNLVFIDQLLWHFNWTGDLEYAREIWPVIERHFEWEKRCFDTDSDGLYNAYCCIWASDALQYSGGGVTHSSAYNYRGNLLAGRLAEMIGQNPEPYLAEAEKIRAAVHEQLWLPRRGWYAEYKDHLGLQLVHPSAALWTIYHALDAGLPDPFQAYQCLRYVDKEIPHIPLLTEGLPEGDHYTLSTSNWMPYTWSINNVALSENLHTSLAYWQGGRKEEAYRLWKSQFLESMYTGASPGNFQQLSFYDAFRGELYRDFADPVGMAARTLVEGLFGIVPDALEKSLIIRPGFPDEWDSAALETPDITLSFTRESGKDLYTVIQNFPVEMDLCLRVKAEASVIDQLSVNGKEVTWENLAESVGNPMIEIHTGYADTLKISIGWTGSKPKLPDYNETVASGDKLEVDFGKARVLELYDPQDAAQDAVLSDHRLVCTVVGLRGHRTVFAKLQEGELEWWQALGFEIKSPIDFLASGPGPGNGLTFQLTNNSKQKIEGKLLVNGVPYTGQELLPGEFSKELVFPPEFLVPGSNRIEFQDGRSVFSGILVNWDITARETFTWDTPDLRSYFNDRVDNIFKNSYLSPRASSPTLQIPVQGIGDWCTYQRLPVIDDSGLRARARREKRIVLDQGIPLLTPGEPDVPNILFTSRWDNYPTATMIPLSGTARHAYFLMAGSAHHMQSRMTNGIISVLYTDGSSETLSLVHPESWWPIEQDYYIDGHAFRVDSPKPPRILLKSGEQQQGNYQVLKTNGTIDIEGGAASLYDLPLDPQKELKGLRLETLVNDVVIGLMSVSLLRDEVE